MMDIFGEEKSLLTGMIEELDGVLGLGPPSVDNMDSLVLMMKEAGLIDLAVFSMNMGDGPENASIEFGGWDPAKIAFEEMIHWSDSKENV